MLKNYIQNMLVGALDEYVEDFTANDIQIDQWNGRIAKENVKLRSTALDWIFTSIFGAPCEIVQGYIKKVVVDVPWTQILSKPVELKIEEIHIILKSRDHYDRDFVKSMLLAAKKEMVDKILADINKKVESKLAETQTKDSYLSKMLKIVYENLRINVRNLHIRFEDTNVSRCDQAFNFGLMAESISYSMTNNRFAKAFLNIDDKIQEQKSFSLLLVTKFAMYWNSNAQDNWTKNKEFINLTAQGTIDFSKRHTDNLMRKHFANKNDFNNNNTGVFLI
jgi:vacuolar protein sorting-associated protein 13A/C